MHFECNNMDEIRTVTIVCHIEYFLFSPIMSVIIKTMKSYTRVEMIVF